jgi:hypothetical protein
VAGGGEEGLLIERGGRGCSGEGGLGGELGGKGEREGGGGEAEGGFPGLGLERVHQV